ncbi:putative pectinesterase 66 [Morella rubra]|uniref:pectinesterase n=1 Tax=Morella rubra TaxID=262757 RepID=A0A6A1UQN8_9ROSI|nr:putative pectinesterase 66 [Morella rubra]
MPPQTPPPPTPTLPPPASLSSPPTLPPPALQEPPPMLPPIPPPPLTPTWPPAKEKVAIDNGKSCIFLDGAGSKFTTIVWDDHKNTKQSATFTSYSDNIVAKGITFENTYNGPFSTEGSTVTQAVAAAVLGDKSAFYYCSFVGVQDTLWDACGRHLFHQCFIQGGIDFIFGNGQSLYEGSEINYSMGPYSSEHGVGSITAEGRELANDPSGFVFTNCSFKGNGKAYLGRAWRNFSRVIVANSILSDVIVPEGWNAWNAEHHVEQLTYVEANCSGPGADTSKRVPWMKKLSATELSHFVSTLFIDQEGWLSQVAKLTNLQSFD